MIFFLRHKVVFSTYIFRISCFLIFFPCLLKSQSLLFPGDYFFDVPRQRAILADTELIVHTSMQPFIYKKRVPDTLKKYGYGMDPFSDKLFYENLIELRHTDKSSGYNRKFNLDINPIFNFSYGKDIIDTATARVSYNTRGIWIRGELGKKLFFETAFIENQSFMERYVYNWAFYASVVPGQGRWKNFKGGGYDYASSYGVLHYAASKNFFVRLGHGKQKIGNGYRSLLLSDNAFNYPYVQFTASFFKNKIQFSQTYALLMNLNDGGSKTPPGTERIFQKKAATFQHLSWHTSKYLDVYLFQGTIWKATDSSNTMHLDPLYANPVMFTNLAKFGFNNVNHILVGGGFEARPLNKLAVYSQFMYDGKSAANEDNSGFQGGIKYFDALGLRNLFMQAEYNRLNGSAYYSSKSAQDYSHYNQVLTTPAWLPNEFVGIVSYYYKKVFVQLKENYFTDNTSKRTTSNFDGKIGYLFNAHYNMNLYAGCTFRTYDFGTAGTKLSLTQIFYIGFKTSLYNTYHDF